MEEWIREHTTLADYGSRLKTHLARYKTQNLGVADDGVWKSSGKHYPHILPEPQQAHNILAHIRDDFWREFSGMDAKLHRDFHHLNSSQAMCFNLFYPFIRNTNVFGELLSSLGLAPRRIETWAFEYEPDPVERTNFDFYLKITDGTQIFFELKLSEVEFGVAEDDARHREKLARIYRSALEGLVDPSALEPEFFFAHYQLLRNISYLANEPSHLFLIYPAANERLQPAVDRVHAMIYEEHRHRVHTVYLENLVDELVSRVLPGDMTAHFNQFAEKYFPHPA